MTVRQAALGLFLQSTHAGQGPPRPSPYMVPVLILSISATAGVTFWSRVRRS